MISDLSPPSPAAGPVSPGLGAGGLLLLLALWAGLHAARLAGKTL
jgi:hypothetical protein